MIAHCLLSSTIRVLAVAVTLLCAAAPAESAKTYFVDGRPVSEEVYQAQDLSNQGGELLNSGQYEKAAALLERAVKQAPELANARLNYGIALGKLGKSTDAIEHLEKAIALDPQLSPGWLTLGGLYQASGQAPKALSTYKKFVEKFPNDKDAAKMKSLIVLLERQIARTGTASATEAAGASDYYAQLNTKQLRHWDLCHMPLKVHVAAGEGMTGFKPGFNQILQDCFAAWASASGGALRFSFVGTPAQADIQCTWTADRSVLRNQAEGGETRIHSESTGYIKAVEITFLTVTLASGRPRTDNQMRLVCLHEIGHALGISGHSTNPDDVMFYSNSFADVARSPTARDRNTLSKIYFGAKTDAAPDASENR